MGGFFEFNPTLELDYSLLPSQILALPQGFATPGLLVGGNANGGGMSIAVGDPTFIIKDAKQLGLYIQDDWKVTPPDLPPISGLALGQGLRFHRRFQSH